MPEPLAVRLALHSDIPQLNALIQQSVRGLSERHYTAGQIEAALLEVFGVDTQLLDDRTYYVIDGDSSPAAAGGWSARRTLYGGDQLKSTNEDTRLDPAREAARIRAFFVHPHYARRGLARRLYAQCARDAYAHGFRHFELMATMPGVPLYEALGFVALAPVSQPMRNGIALPLLHMRRAIEAPE
ncbi:MAG: GNAT family N-acetyltransferase [Gemmatimonas sp.]